MDAVLKDAAAVGILQNCDHPSELRWLRADYAGRVSPVLADVLPLRTPRLVIRACTVDDLDAVWEYRRLPEVNHWLSRAPQTREDFHTVYSAPALLGSMLVIELADDSGTDADGRRPLIGDVAVHIEDGWAQAEVAERARGVQAELGWALHPSHVGRGFATEAVRAVIGCCFGPLGLLRVHAGCFTANEPSWRLMERIGMRREEDSRATGLHRSGQWLDGLNYALLAEEWPT